MLKNSVSLAPDTNGLKSIGQSGEVRYLHSGDIFEATRTVKIVRNPVRFGTDLPGYIADVWSEPLPLARNSFACFKSPSRLTGSGLVRLIRIDKSTKNSQK